MTHSRETIVLVHGTFSSPRDGMRQWWQGGLDGDFASKLDDALARRGIQVRCWSHCAEPQFHWSGENDWIARVAASAALSRYISGLAREGWRCHLVGHSHGGNVIVDSLSALHGRPEERAVASVVTLGTPFLDMLGDVDPHKRKRRLASAGMFAVAALVFGLASVPALIDIRNAGLGLQALIGAVFAILIALIASVLTPILRDRARRKRANRATPIPALALNSRFDEAWQLLHHVRETPNPLAISGGLWRYLGRQMRAYVVRKQAAQKAIMPFEAPDVAVSGWLKWLYRLLYTLIVCAGMFPIWTLGWGVPGVLVGFAYAFMAFIAFAAPIAIVSIGWSRGYMAAFMQPLDTGMHSIASLGIVPGEVVTYLVRKRSWELLQRWVMGLDGYRFALPSVKTMPAVAGAARFQFESLDAGAEKRALTARSQWLSRHVDGATEVFSQLVLSASDAVRLLHEIEQDASLVHAAYYMDDASINRIADWIAANSASSSGMEAADLCSRSGKT